jgi:hypothetical protein
MTRSHHTTHSHKTLYHSYHSLHCRCLITPYCLCPLPFLFSSLPLQLGFRDTANTSSPSNRKDTIPGSDSGGGPGSFSASRGDRALPPVPQTATPLFTPEGSDGGSQGSSVSYPPPPAPVTSSPAHTQNTDTSHTESHREMGRLAAEEEGDSVEDQRQLTQHSSDGQGPTTETHGTYLEALTGSTYSTLYSTTFFFIYFL